MRLRQQLRKLLAERMRTLLNGLPWCAISHHGVVRNHQDFVTRQSRRQIVRDQQTTDVALLNTTAEQLKDLRFGDWIERTGGLISDDQVGTTKQRNRNTNTLALTTR